MRNYLQMLDISFKKLFNFKLITKISATYYYTFLNTRCMFTTSVSSFSEVRNNNKVNVNNGYDDQSQDEFTLQGRMK